VTRGHLQFRDETAAAQFAERVRKAQGADGALDALQSLELQRTDRHITAAASMSDGDARMFLGMVALLVGGYFEALEGDDEP
jgi:hypothetical protein